MKQCGHCKDILELSSFSKCARHKDGLQKACKKCMSEYAYKRYRKDGAWKAQLQQRNRESREVSRQYVTELLVRSKCADCGEADPVVLDFHHVSGVKVKEVSIIKNCSYSLERVKAEIAKCIIVCANCHRRRHAKERAESHP